MQVADVGNAVTPTPTTVNPGGPPVYTPGAGAPPPVTPATGPDSITVGATPGYTPDYTGAIQSDPGYAAAQAANQQAQNTAQAQRQAQMRAAVIQYGGMPQGYQDAYGDIDQATLDAAKNNQYSTLAGLNRNYQQSTEQFRRALAARGALQSGDLNYGQDQIDTGYGQNEYDAGNVFGNNAQGYLNQYAGVLDADSSRSASAIQQAAANAYADPNNRPTAATPGSAAGRNAGLSSKYGIDIYTDADGNNYDRNGNAWTAPATPAYDPTNSPWNRTPGIQL
jgi:hypothetical protein